MKLHSFWRMNAPLLPSTRHMLPAPQKALLCPIPVNILLKITTILTSIVCSWMAHEWTLLSTYSLQLACLAQHDLSFMYVTGWFSSLCTYPFSCWWVFGFPVWGLHEENCYKFLYVGVHVCTYGDTFLYFCVCEHSFLLDIFPGVSFLGLRTDLSGGLEDTVKQFSNCLYQFIRPPAVPESPKWLYLFAVTWYH